jgi:hypothetical protein
MPDHHDDLRTMLAAIAERLDRRVDVWRIIVDEKGREVERLLRGSCFPATPKPEEPPR